MLRTATALPCESTTQLHVERTGINLESLLFKLPDSLIRANVLPGVEKSSSLAAFARSSFYTHKLAQPELDQRGIEKLFAHIVNGQPDEVKMMLDANPHLTLIKRKTRNKKDEVIKNKAGQCFTVQGKTVYQIAFGEEDIEIAAMIKSVIVKVADEEEGRAQYNSQFPPGWEEAEKKKWAPIFAQLNTIAEVVRDAKPGDIISSGDPEYKLTVREESEVAHALAQLRSLLDVMLNEPVTTGRHFNPNLPLQAFKIYNDHYGDYFGNDSRDPRALLFLQQVIGYSERLFPANYMQAACESFHNTAEKLKRGEPQRRSFKFEVFNRHSNTWVQVDLDPLSVSRLGFDFAIYRGRADVCGGRAVTRIAGMSGLASLCQSKTDCAMHLFYVDVKRQNFLIWFR